MAARASVDLVLAGDPPPDDIVSLLAHVHRLDKRDPPPPPVSKLGRRLRDLRIAAFGREPYELLMEQPARAALEAVLPDPSSYNAVIVEHRALALLVRHRRGHERWILELQNVGSQRSTQQAAVAGHWRHRLMWQRDARRAERLERWIGAHYDLVVSVSAEDAVAFGANDAVVPNGVDLATFKATLAPAGAASCSPPASTIRRTPMARRGFAHEVLPRSALGGRRR